MSFNMNLEETTRLLGKAAKMKQLEEISKEFDEIKKHTLVLTEEEQKVIEDQQSLNDNDFVKDAKAEPNASTLVVNSSNGEKRVSTIFWNKGPIVVDENASYLRENFNEIADETNKTL